MDRIDPATMVASDPDVVGCELGEGAALLNLRSNIYYSLNEVGAFVWDEMAQQPVAFARLVDRVCDTYDAPAERVEEDLARLVCRMDAAGLVRCTRR
ncbi:MAG: PqqD family peptide modification chaperone [Porphyrobacter sp.]|nr:PqqD family peptide modification chaperone [Porphyrobacter sp.]